jgi:peptide-methionine (S)-S-oxide reductase
MFWRVPGVHTTAVGYVGGHTPNPTYEEVCSGRTGHTECVQVLYDPAVVSFADLLAMHWTCHDPTQGNRQGNDRGTQYRSGIYCDTDAQFAVAKDSAEAYSEALKAAGKNGTITSEIKGPGDTFYYAEDYHQQ